MMKKMAFITGCFFLLLPFMAHGFDCIKPEFGARLEELNKDGYFVKYMENDGIAYYNYTGPCRMDMHEESNPAYAFAFVDRKSILDRNRRYGQDIKGAVDPEGAGTLASSLSKA